MEKFPESEKDLIEKHLKSGNHKIGNYTWHHHQEQVECNYYQPMFIVKDILIQVGIVSGEDRREKLWCNGKL